MNEERMRILKMIEAGKVSAEEGISLLEAIDENINETIKPKSKGKFLVVKVDGDDKVNIRVPLALVDAGLKIGSKYEKDLENKLGGIQLEEMLKMAQEGAEGQIVDIETEDGESVKVYVE